jgi:hypothetical protein
VNDAEAGGGALLQRTIAEIRAEFPDFRIVAKRDHALSKVIDVLLRVLTLGAQHQYLSHYHTVLGNTLYVPDKWESTPEVDQVITLRHERVHLRQRRRYGDVLMAFLYVVPFLPLGLAYGRARIEWEAYSESIRATAELQGYEAAASPALRAHIVRQFVSGAYGWMWPFPGMVEKWYEVVLQGIRRRTGKASEHPGDPRGVA